MLCMARVVSVLSPGFGTDTATLGQIVVLERGYGVIPSGQREGMTPDPPFRTTIWPINERNKVFIW